MSVTKKMQRNEEEDWVKALEPEEWSSSELFELAGAFVRSDPSAFPECSAWIVQLAGGSWISRQRPPARLHECVI